MLRPGYNRSKLIVALARLIEGRFKGDWLELGHLTGTADIVQRHSRLLRSLEWRDPDYSGCVMEVLPQVLDRAEGGANAVVELTNLSPWLEENEPALYAELFAGELVPLDDVAEASSILGVGELEAHTRRIRSTGVPA